MRTLHTQLQLARCEIAFYKLYKGFVEAMLAYATTPNYSEGGFGPTRTMAFVGEHGEERVYDMVADKLMEHSRYFDFDTFQVSPPRPFESKLTDAIKNWKPRK